MTEIEIEGKTVEDAIKEGLEKLGCSRDKVEIKILNEGTAGLFGLMGTKPSRVLLTVKQAGAGNDACDYVLARERAKEIMSELLRLMHVSFKEINTAMLTGRILLNVIGDEGSLIIGKNGQTLEALEHILNLMLHRDEKTRVKVTLDTENYRQKQEERINNMAMKAAAQVKQTGKPYRFDPMTSKERRLIHMSLKNDADVETTSEDEGSLRKVVIRPKKK